jgi:hypothetical protein
MVYLRIALAEAKTDIVQDLRASFMRSSKRMARSRCSRKFSSITKKDCTLSSVSIFCMTSNSSSPLSKKLTKFPLPPKKADVVQKLQPMGQPTEGMIVAAVAPLRSGKRIPMMRVRMPETMAGCRMGALSSSPR